MRAALLFPLMLAGPAAADVPAGEFIDDAALLDVTPEGLAALPALAPILLPDKISVATTSDGDWYYGYKVENMWIGMELGDTTVIPDTQLLDIDSEILVKVNDSSDPFALTVELIGISSTCDGHVEQTPIYAALDLGMEVIDPGDGTPPVIDVTVTGLDVDISELDGDDIVLEDCALGTIIDVLDWFGLDVEGLILDNLAGPLLEDQIGDLGTTLEETLEDAFDALVIAEEFELEGIIATLDLYPSDVIIDSGGLRLQLAGRMNVDETAQCIAAYDDGSSYSHGGAQPIIREVPVDVTEGYHASVFLSDEFGNQALYSLWRGGLLCQTVDSELTGGISLDSSILQNLATPEDSEEGYLDHLWGEDESHELIIYTVPKVAPTLVYDGDNDIVLSIEDMGLDMVTELAHRQARIVQVDLALDAGIDLLLDPSTGAIEIAANIQGDDIVANTSVNEFAPEANEEIADGISGLFDAMVGPLIDGLLGDLAIQLPSFSGLGLTALEISAAGEDEDWLGAYAMMGEVPYESAGGLSGGCGDEGGDSCGGCGEDGSDSCTGCGDGSEDGCTVGDEGCDNWDGGCSEGGGSCSVSGKFRGRLALLALPLGLALMRRREEDAV